MNILSLDQSTNSTGFSVYYDDKLITYGLFDISDEEDTIERIHNNKMFLDQAIDLYKIDKVLLEEIQLQKRFNPKTKSMTILNVETYKVLAQLQGVLIEFLHENNVPYEVIASSTWKSKSGIKGRDRETQKKNTIQFVKKTFNADVSTDIADSICLGYAYLKMNGLIKKKK